MTGFSNAVQKAIMAELRDQLSESITYARKEYALFSPTARKAIANIFEKQLLALEVSEDLRGELEDIEDDEEDINRFAKNFVGYFDIDDTKFKTIGNEKHWLTAEGMCKYIEQAMGNLYDSNTTLGKYDCSCGCVRFFQKWVSGPTAVFNQDKDKLTLKSFRHYADLTLEDYLSSRSKHRATPSSAPSTPQK